MGEGREITDIQEFSKKKARIDLDGEFAFVLYKKELSSYRLEKGLVLPEETYRMIYDRLLPARAKKRCLDLLKGRAYPEQALLGKLRDGGYPEEIIRQAMDYVKSYGYVDDADYACQYIFYRRESCSPRLLEEKLRAKGISAETVWQAMEIAYPEEERQELQHSLARRYLEKKGYGVEKSGPKEKQRMYAYLMRKGIPSPVIRRAMEGWQAPE